jgi:uncharacterized membrane protein YcaP (DUF421 family)
VSAEVLAVAARAVAAYAVLLGLLRASGKRTIAEGTAFDFVLALVIGDMVDDVLLGKVSLATFAVGAGALTLMHTFVSWIKLLHPAIDRLVDGQAAVVLSHGVPVAAGLRREHMSEADLESLLRLRGISRERWNEVQTAQLEDNGAATVLHVLAERPATRRDLDPVPRP